MEPDESAEQVRTPPAERDGEARPAADIRQSRRFGRRLDTWGWLAMFAGAALVGIDVGGNSDGLGWAVMVGFFAIPALFGGSAVGVVAAVLGAGNLFVVAVAVPVVVCLLLFRRDVRDWVESRM